MSTKIATATQNWPNVNQVIESMKKEDKTLIKIIKFAPHIIKLIGAIISDVLNKVINFSGLSSKTTAMRDEAGKTHTQKSGIVQNIWANHKRKFLFSAIAVGSVIGILFATRYYYSIYPFDPWREISLKRIEEKKYQIELGDKCAIAVQAKIDRQLDENENTYISAVNSLDSDRDKSLEQCDLSNNILDGKSNCREIALQFHGNEKFKTFITSENNDMKIIESSEFEEKKCVENNGLDYMPLTV